LSGTKRVVEVEGAVGGAAFADVSRPPYLWAAAAALAVFALYALTLAPTAAFWDASEYVATAHILGIPHPPGNPLFIVLARTWEVLLGPFGLSAAVRINLFSAFVSALAHGLWFLVVHHILRYFTDDARFRLAGAAVAVLVSATAFTVWNQSNVNEKVYTVSLLTIALLTWLAFRWQENLGRGKDDNLLVLMAFVLALSVGNHLMAFLAAPAILLFVLVVHARTLLNWKLYPAVLIAGLVGLSIHLLLPLRAGLAPVINEAAPTCEGLGEALAAIATMGKAGCVALGDALQRTQYDKPALMPRLAPLHMQLLNYLQYFDWQWARSLGDRLLFAVPRLPFTMLFTGLGVWGAAEHHRRDKASFYYFLALFATVSVGLVYYLNFKYGFSIPAPIRDVELHEVRERDYFFMVSFSVWGLWVGVGIAALWQWGAERFGSLAKASPVLALAVLPLVLNASRASRSGDYTARDWGYNLLMSVEPYGILFTNGDNDTFPLWYIQEVEGVRRDVTVIVTSYLNTPWYARQLRDLTEPCAAGESPDQDPTRVICQRPYNGDNEGAVYTAGPEPPPDDSKVPVTMAAAPLAPPQNILPFPDSTIDRIAGAYYQLPDGRTFELGDGRVVANVPAGTVLYPWHQFALSIVNQALGKRPIYFASSGSSAYELGLDRYLVRQGLAFRVREGGIPEEAAEGIEPMPTNSPLSAVMGPYVDVPRTATLLDEVFVHRSGLPEWERWPDHATIGIPNYYAWAYWALAQAAFQREDAAAAEVYQQRAEAWTRLGS
jgi:hypothetical protein